MQFTITLWSMFSRISLSSIVLKSLWNITPLQVSRPTRIVTLTFKPWSCVSLSKSLTWDLNCILQGGYQNQSPSTWPSRTFLMMKGLTFRSDWFSFTHLTAKYLAFSGGIASRSRRSLVGVPLFGRGLRTVMGRLFSSRRRRGSRGISHAEHRTKS